MRSIEPIPTRTKVDSGAVNTAALTTRDNVDSTGRPPLSTFHPVKLGHRSPKVDSDAVDTVTALSTATVDSISARYWVPLSGFAPDLCNAKRPQLPRWHRVVDVVTTPAAFADAVTWTQRQDSGDLLLPPRTIRAGQLPIGPLISTHTHPR